MTGTLDGLKVDVEVRSVTLPSGMKEIRGTFRGGMETYELFDKGTCRYEGPAIVNGRQHRMIGDVIVTNAKENNVGEVVGTFQNATAPEVLEPE